MGKDEEGRGRLTKPAPRVACSRAVHCTDQAMGRPGKCAAEKELAAQAAGTCVASPSGPKNPQAERALVQTAGSGPL